MDKKTKAKLIEEYREADIMICEGRLFNPECMTDWRMSFHHIPRQSTCEAEDTFEKTRLLCAACHSAVHTGLNGAEFEEWLKQLR